MTFDDLARKICRENDTRRATHPSYWDRAEKHLTKQDQFALRAVRNALALKQVTIVQRLTL